MSQENMLAPTTYVNQTTHEVSLDIVKLDDKKYREERMKNIIAATCAMLNTNGGKVLINVKGNSQFVFLDFPGMLHITSM